MSKVREILSGFKGKTIEKITEETGYDVDFFNETNPYCYIIIHFTDESRLRLSGEDIDMDSVL